MVEQRGPQVFHDAALHVHRLVDGLRQPLQARKHLGVGDLAVAFEPGDVDLGRRQDAAELVVQVAREAALVALAGGLEVAGQRGKLLGARSHLPLEQGGLGFELRAMELAQLELAHHHVGQHGQEREVDEADQPDADALLHQGAPDVALALIQHPQLLFLERVGLGDEVLHQLDAVAGAHQHHGLLVAALLLGGDGEAHLVELAGGHGDERAGALGGQRVALGQRREVDEVLLRARHGLVERLQVAPVLHQQIAALRRLRHGPSASRIVAMLAAISCTRSASTRTSRTRLAVSSDTPSTTTDTTAVMASASSSPGGRP